jgi:glutaredoxin-like YruB-family protein
MAVLNISSHKQMLQLMEKASKNYVLLYKSNSGQGECSLQNILSAAKKFEKVNVLVADVSTVRDIHTHYNITSSPSLLIFEGERFINVVKGCNDPAYYISLFEESYFHPVFKKEETKQKRVTLYSTPSCSWCNVLKNHLKASNIRFTEVDVSQNQEAAEQMVRRSGQRGVPQTDIDGQIIVGFDKNKINSLLGIQ